MSGVVPVTGALLLVAALAYPAGLLAGERRGRAWPVARTLCWYAGLAVVAVATLGPLADPSLTGPAGHAGHLGHGGPAADGGPLGGTAAGPLGGSAADGTRHALGHLALGMLAPLLLVAAAPLTLALRGLPAAAGRRVSAVLRSAPVRVLTLPAVAAVLDVGGLWLLYRTDLLAVASRSPAGHALLGLHVLLAGYLFTWSVVGVDPAPHRPGTLHRGVVLVLAAAAHAVLAKSLYAAPPPGATADAARAAAQVMWYGGDVVELALLGMLALRWYRRAPPAPADGTAPAGYPARTDQEVPWTTTPPTPLPRPARSTTSRP